MSVAEKRAENRRRVTQGQASTRPPGSLREDGMTGAEVLEIWKRTGAAGAHSLRPLKRASR